VWGSGPRSCARRQQGSDDWTTIAAFPRTTPLPTFGLQGSVYTGTTPATGGLAGARVEVVSGLVAGRGAVAGLAPEPVPGFTSLAPATRGVYMINGVAAGTMRLRATAAGYQPLERDVTVTLQGVPGSVDFQLQPTSGM
jgi:hypothetical protein